MPYIPLITETLRALERSDVNPWLVEEWLRDTWGTLDHLTRETLREQIVHGVNVLDAFPDIKQIMTVRSAPARRKAEQDRPRCARREAIEATRRRRGKL